MTCNILRQVEGFPCLPFENNPMSITFTYLPCHVADDAVFFSQGKYLLNFQLFSFSFHLAADCCQLLLNFPVECRRQTASHRRCASEFTAGIAKPPMPQQMREIPALNGPLVCVWKRHTDTLFFLMTQRQLSLKLKGVCVQNV